MNHRQRHAEACAELLKDFELDDSKMKSRYVERNHLILELTRQGLYSREIAEKLGISPKTVQKFWVRHNFPRLHNLEPPRREERLGWKGGVKNLNGYLYSRTPGHPHGSKHGCYVAVHRLVVEEHLGRYLLPSEVVHHLDDNPLNNHIDNLEVYSSNGEHLRDTLKGKCPNWSDEGKKRTQEHALKRPRDKSTKRFL